MANSKRTPKLFYIGQRNNPQASKPYFKAFGQLTQKVAKAKENCSYGSMWMTGFETEELYREQLKKLEEQGYRIIK